MVRADVLMGEAMPCGQDEPLSALRSADAAFDRLMRDVRVLDQPRPTDSRTAAERVANLLSAIGATPGPPAWGRPAAARSFDLLSELVTEAVAAIAEYVDSGLLGGEEGAARPGETSVVLSGSPGNRTGTHLWIHGGEGVVVDLSSLRLTDLTAHHGSRIAGTAGTFSANAGVPSGARSIAIWLDVAIPDDSPAGTYHGHVLSAASPGTATNVRMSVQP